MSAGETTVGAIVGTLRLQTDQFDRAIDEAIAKTHQLDGTDVKVDVKADTADAETKLAAVKASEDKVDESNKRIAVSGKGAEKGISGIAVAALALGPALIPLAAGAAGAAAGMSAMGAVGILAIIGIRQEMAQGTAVGQQYSAALGTLRGDLSTLGDTAAAGVLRPFQDAVTNLQQRMPNLNQTVGEFSGLVGRTGASITSGLLAAFVALEPLMRQVGTYVAGLAQQFDALMSGHGVVAFGEYARSVFPQVVATLQAVGTAAVHLVEALAPLGMGALGALRMFADAINAIPVHVLADLATVVVPLVVGFKAFTMLSGPLHGVATALQSVGVSAETAAVGVRALTLAAGVVGAAIAVATFLYTAHANAARDAQAAENGFADALRASGGAIDESVRQAAIKQLSDAGALTLARELKVGLSDVTDAALGNADATARVTAALKPYHDALVNAELGSGAVTNQTQKQADESKKLLEIINTQSDGLKNSAQAFNDQTTALDSGSQATGQMAAAQQTLASGLGTTLPILQAASAAQQQQASSAAAATVQMQLENNAAGLLKAALDALAGKSLSYAQAQNAVDSQLANMGDHLTATGKKVHFTTTSIGNMSAASVALRGQLLGQVSAAETTAEAYGNLTGSTEKGREKLIALRAQIIANAVAHGVDKAAVTAFIDQVLKVPTAVPPTKLQIDANTAAASAKVAALQRQIDALAGKPISIGTGPLANKRLTTSANGNLFTAFAAGGFEQHVAQIAHGGGTRVWNEPETGGEAYIPLSPSKRARSLAIWEETGRRLGAGPSMQSTTHQQNIGTINVVAHDYDDFQRQLDREQRLASLRGGRG